MQPRQPGPSDAPTEGQDPCVHWGRDDQGAFHPDEAAVERAIAQAKRGNREGIRFLYCHYAARVLRSVRSVIADEYEAQDVTQDVFLKLITAVGSYERGSVPFSAWLTRVSRNVAIDHLRRRRPTPLDELPESLDRESFQDRHERAAELSAAFAELEQSQREVMLLRHVKGLQPREIAERLAKTESSIHGLHHRGRRSLQENLRLRGVAPVTAA